MGDFFTKLKDWWANAEGTQKIFAVGGAALFGALLIGVFFFAGKPHMALLFSGLPANEQGLAVQELEKDGIKTDVNDHGDVMVANDKIAEARMKLAVANKLPASGGFTDFDKELSGIGIMSTPPVEKERLKGILEQRIAESIQSMEGITAARVHIVLAEEKAFISEAKPATASITITQAANSTISKDQGKGIATLAANSVPGLTMSNVAVLNNRMEMLYDGHDLESATGNSNERFAAEDLESRKYADSLQHRLDAVYGPGSTLVSVHMELDFNQVQSTTDESKPTDGVPTEKNVEKMDGKKPIVGGPSGAISNTPPSAGGAPASNTGATTDSSYTNQHTSFQLGATNTHVSKVEAPGTVKAMGINIIANSDKVTDSANLTSIIDGELGPKAADPNFTRKVTLVKFDTTAAKAEAAAVATAAGNARMQQLISMIPMIALIGFGFFVLRQVIKITRPQPVAAESVELATLPPPGQIADAIDVSGLEITAEALMEANGGVLPEGVTVNPQTGLVVLDGTENLSEEDRMRIVKGISAKVNVPLEQIKRMCQDRPEAVAMLIKGWLLEEKQRA